MSNTTGTITQIVGVVVDVEFKSDLPALYDALLIEQDGKTVTLEVAQHLDETSVRAIALSSTGHTVVLVTNNLWVKTGRARSKHVNRRIDTNFGKRTVHNDRCIKVGKRCCRCWVGKVVGRDVDSLY